MPVGRTWERGAAWYDRGSTAAVSTMGDALSERHVVIYSSPDANMAIRLKEHLEQVGIQADILRESNGRIGATGANPLHGSTALEGRRTEATSAANVQVMVAESDQMVAQQIALEFG